MKFKVGDKVRLTREAIINYAEDGEFENLEYYNEFQIIKIEGSEVFYGDDGGDYYTEKELEFVPEEPEFTYGEEIEVQARGQDEWYKAIFICKIPGKYRSPYVCVEEGKKDNFKNGERYEIVRRDFARKLRPQLTRKEIAEKFGVSEDFTLIE